MDLLVLPRYRGMKSIKIQKTSFPRQMQEKFFLLFQHTISLVPILNHYAILRKKYFGTDCRSVPSPCGPSSFVEAGGTVRGKFS
uniref:Uncharacterized protein n=1 Tax=Rhizoctonia solani TaxID=456999 RepID=N0A748_9AGAM|nr:hypothetical protein RSOL_m01530 [Rhizoctonia solani]AGK45462.1 hypothetical protein RSOL_m01530 [Rhizoctonia solani]